MGNTKSTDSFRITDTQTGYSELNEQRNMVGCICISRDEAVFVSGRDKCIDLWDAKLYDKIATLESHTDQITGVCLSPDRDLMASGAADGTLRIWAKPGGRWACIDVLRNNHAGWAWTVSWLRDIGFVSGGTDGQLIFWQVSHSGGVTQLMASHCHEKSITGVCVIPLPLKLYIVSVSNDSGIVVNELSQARTAELELNFVKRISGHVGEIYAVDGYTFPNNNGSIFVTCGEDKTVRIWSLSDVTATASSVISSTVPHVVFSCETPVYCVKLSHDGRFVVAGGEDTLHIFKSPLPFLRTEAMKTDRVQLKKLPGGIRSIIWGHNNSGLYVGLDNGSISAISVPFKYHRPKLLHSPS